MQNYGTYILLLSVAIAVLLSTYFDQPIIYTALIVTSISVLAYTFYSPKIKIQNSNTFKFSETKNPKEHKHIVLWDRTTVDLPSLSYLQQYKFDAIYFCTTTGEKPDLSLIRPASKADKIYHWEYRTVNETNLKLYLLLALYHIHYYYGQDVNLHIFTRDPELKTRFKIHANGYKLNNLIFKTDKL